MSFAVIQFTLIRKLFCLLFLYLILSSREHGREFFWKVIFLVRLILLLDVVFILVADMLQIGAARSNRF